ncbi:unnamed protein product [Agarophyton chilense]|eukprot:gb/GEZJ01002331.1/.p1 GENE.gb/GEZJ01002331.1/~~gb/GEZJ01002331.1/.p1  ORF type:complete len:1067 (+),score=146.99 gb/GEZJ01002331.1/:14998-18198(+)
MAEHTTPASLNFLCATTDLTSEDCRPITLPEAQSQLLSRPVQRTVFQIGSEWDSVAADAVLDAFHLSLPAEIGPKSPEAKSLKFSRASGSVEVDAEMADIFAEPTPCFSSDKAALYKNTALPLVQCCICYRPILFTRAVSHMKSCRSANDTSGFTQDHMPSTPTSVSDEEKKSLICAPYVDAKQDGKSNDCSQSSATPAVRGSNHSQNEKKESVRTSSKVRKVSIPRDEDDWETSLTPISESMPRCSSYRKRRVLLPHIPDTQRKRLQSEKKAITAANTTGLYPPSNPRHSSGITSKHPDPIREVARKCSARIPWAKLMHTALPLPLRTKLTPRKRKFSRAIGTVSLDTDGSSFHPTNTNGNVKNLKPSEGFDRCQTMAQQQQHPSLIGALLWLRGHVSREIFGTPLQHMDVPSSLYARNPTLFHGQTVVSKVGTFETDPRPISTIKLPSSVTRKSKVSVARALTTLPSLATGHVDKEQRGVPPKAAPAPANGTMPPKKPKVPKLQPMHANGHAFPTLTPKHAQATAGNGVARSGPRTQPPLNPARITPELQRQFFQARQMSKVAAKAAINGSVTSAAIAASNYANVHQPPQRNMYLNHLPPSIPGMHTQTVNPAVHPSAHLPTTMSVTPIQGTKSTGSRGSIARHPIANQLAGVSPGMRPAGAISLRNQSPSQGSSRSADRVPRVPIPAEVAAAAAARPYDAGLLASAAQQMPRVHAPHSMYNNQNLEFQHMLAQLAGANRQRDDLSALGNGPNPGLPGDVGDVVGRNMQGMTPLSSVKPGGSVHNTQQVSQMRDPSLLKPNVTPRIPIQNTDQNMSQRARELEQQLRQGSFMLNSNAVANLKAANLGGALNGGYAKRTSPPQLGVPNMSQDAYDAALAAAAAASNAMAPNALAMKNQQFLRMAPNSLAAAPSNLAMLQNMRDMSNITGLPLFMGMPGQSHGNNVMNFMPPAATAPGMQNPALSNAMGHNVTGKGVGQGQSMSLLSSNPILQQIFGAKGLGANLSNSMHPQQFAEENGQLNIMQGMRPVAAAQSAAQELAPGDKASFLNEIDKVFGEKDAHDSAF